MTKLVSTGAALLALTVAPAFAASPVACGTQFGTPKGTGVWSDTFDNPPEGWDFMDGYGAADFRVQTQCTLNEVDVKGQYGGPGPATSVDVIFYRNVPNANMPGAPVKGYTGLRFSDPGGTGNFTIPIPSTTLTTGVYWVSVAANIDAEKNGAWSWSQQHEQTGFPDMFRGNGQDATPYCYCWDTMANCAWDSGDLMFVLRGAGQ